MDKKSRFSPPAVGAVSLLVVFAVLCLTVFALLSLTTVQADVRLADAAAEAVTNYYAADLKAQTVFACLRTGSALPSDVSVALTEVETADEEGAEAAASASYAVPISDTQELQVELSRSPDGTWTVLRWQSVPTGNWTYDDSLGLWDGDLIVID